MTLDEFLKLLDWTGRQFRTDNRGSIPATCAPILDRLDCSEERNSVCERMQVRGALISLKMGSGTCSTSGAMQASGWHGQET